MKTRILRPEEWASIDMPDLPALLPFVDPQNIAIIRAEDASGKPIGYLSALRMTHLEGLWVRPDRRGGRVAWALYQQATALARRRRENWVIGGAACGDDRMDDLVQRCAGQPLALRFYTMPTKGDD